MVPGALKSRHNQGARTLLRHVVGNDPR